jgi:hypothetical protein
MEKLSVRRAALAILNETTSAVKRRLTKRTND